jgi:hypothetical protein
LLSAGHGISGRAADSSRCASDSGTATAPRATAALRTVWGAQIRSCLQIGCFVMFGRVCAPHALIARKLADLPPLDFVSDVKSVIDPHRGCAVVKDHGVLVTLGQISKGKAHKVNVRGQIFFACLGAAACGVR